MDKFIAALLEKSDECQIYAIEQTLTVPVRRRAEILAKDDQQAIDMLEHDAIDWTITHVAGQEFPDIEKIRRLCRSIERIRADRDIAWWRSVAWYFAATWAVDRLLPVILQVLR